MQEEVTQKTIALVIKTAKLDANVLKAAMRMYLNHRRQKAQKTHGKTSVKKLVGEGVGVSSIEVTDGNIKSFERVARKYNVDFAVKKDKTTDLYRPLKVRPKKSNFWRSVFFWQNIVVNSSKKLFLNISKEALGINN